MQNLVRQALYYNFDHYHAEGKGAFKNADHVLKAHISMSSLLLRRAFV